jgi:hypothetical protein
MARYETALTVINDAAVELGFAAVTDPFASTDPVFIQLVRFLKGVGRELVREVRWSQLQKEATFTTAAPDTGIYDLPTDFISMVPQTGWDRTNANPWGGPLSGEIWQYIQADTPSSLIDVYARFWLDKLYLYPTPAPVGLVIAYEYRSRYWVMPSGETTPTADAPTAGTDTLWFDPTLLVAALKLKWKEANGFDTSSALAERLRLLASCRADMAPSPVLHLDGRGGSRFRLLDGANVPDSGFG